MVLVPCDVSSEELTKLYEVSPIKISVPHSILHPNFLIFYLKFRNVLCA